MAPTDREARMVGGELKMFKQDETVTGVMIQTTECCGNMEIKNRGR